MKATLRIYICVLLSSALHRGWGEVILGVETDEFDFDGLPGAQHEFKVEVGAGKEECFYQKVVAGGKMHVSFEVCCFPVFLLLKTILTPSWPNERSK